MATFEEQVEALTGIAIGTSDTNPTKAELDQFLRDGVLDVTSKWLIGHPEDRELFMDETGLQVAQGADISGAEIISVVRVDGVTAGNFRPCRKISPAMQSQVTDTESLSFASKYNPVYMLSSDTTVKVFPAPSDNSGKDSYKIYYVNNIPKDSSGTSLTFADSTLGYFPADKVYLVAIYAAIKSINNNMAAITADLSSFILKTVPPDFAAAYDDPDNLDAQGESIATEIQQMLDYIETNEDVELANAKASEIGLRFKRAIDEFQSGLSKYSGEIQGYAQEVQAEVSEQGQKVQTETAKYQWLQDRHAALQAEYIAAFGTPKPQGEGR